MSILIRYNKYEPQCVIFVFYSVDAFSSWNSDSFEKSDFLPKRFQQRLLRDQFANVQVDPNSYEDAIYDTIYDEENQALQKVLDEIEQQDDISSFNEPFLYDDAVVPNSQDIDYADVPQENEIESYSALLRGHQYVSGNSLIIIIHYLIFFYFN